VAIVGTGIRGSGMWGKDLLADVGDRVEIVGLCDLNRKRVEVCKNYIARDIPTFTNLEAMLEQTRPEKLIVCTKDSTHFHWYLDIYHGADYFRRWHAYKENSGTLFVHKATHHFDMINWFLEADPVEVNAFASLRKYGRNGAFRSRNCRGCAFKEKCEFYWDIVQEPKLVALYVNCESEDGYLRDGCVFREDINIYDTMTANVKYSTGAMMSYSLNAFMPYEGYHLAFNGTNGRLEVRNYERQPWEVAQPSEIRLTKNFGNSEMIESSQADGGHGDADPMMKRMIFDPDMPDPYKQRAGSRAGAMSALTGIAAVKSVERGKPVKIAELIKL
jgi:predicted dehydrogenase